VFDLVSSNIFIRDLVRFAIQSGTILNAEKPIAFDIRDLLKLFEVKSTVEKSKSLYHYILKICFKLDQHEYSSLVELKRCQTIQIFSEKEITLIKASLREGFETVPSKINSLIQAYEFVFAQVNSWDNVNDPEFYQSMLRFIEIYELTAQSTIQAKNESITSKLSNFLEYFCESSVEGVDKVL
jgi:hypothetical protein